MLDLQTKLRRLSDVGLGYLSLERQAGTLSGGETQRLRLAAALTRNITGIFYMLDEPTVGLHPQIRRV
ncbi:MAG: ATP-binding cassette domain-containing protein [Ruthenibacterium lactatiformans]